MKCITGEPSTCLDSGKLRKAQATHRALLFVLDENLRLYTFQANLDVSQLSYIVQLS